MNYVMFYTNKNIIELQSLLFLIIYGSTALCWPLAAVSVPCSYTQPVELLGWRAERHMAAIHTNNNTPRYPVGFEPTT
jgi:hypothetical protein